MQRMFYQPCLLKSMLKINRQKRSALWLAMIAGSAATLSHPQSALAASGVLEEVVVEAQKKVETITQTPIAIQALTGDQFQKNASFNLQDISRTTPGLKFDTGVLPDIHLRGVSTVTLAAVSLRTNIYQDGALISQPRAVFDAQFDIERFEVLKGPQGTLYGKSSPTGTINIRTKSPNLSEVDGYVAGSLGQYNMRNTQFGVSLPIIEGKLGVRLAAVYDENQATDQFDVTTRTHAQSRASAARMTVLWEPSDDFNARLSYHYREKKNNPWYTVNGDGYRADQDKVIANFPDEDRYRDQLATLELTKTLSDHLSLVSVTAYEDQEYLNFQDIDASATSLSPNILPLGNVRYTRIPLRPQIQEDLRLASEDNDFWDWQIGGYYARTATATAVNDVGVQQGVPTDVHTTAELFGEEFAVYTHNTFKLTDELSLIAGLRYQQARQNANEPTEGATVNADGSRTPISTTFIAADGIPSQYSKLTYHPVTGTLKLQYFFNPDWMGYVSIDRAYRTGGANLNIQGNTPNDFALIPAESANSIELGLKANFWDQRGRFAIALYDQVYKNFQQDIQNIIVYSPVFNGPTLMTSTVASAKEAEVRGLEGDVSLLLLDNWDISFGLAITDSKFNDFKNNPCTPGDTSVLTAAHPYASCDLSGQRLPLSSRWSGTFASNYSLPAFDGADWYFNTLLSFQSDQIDKVTRDTLGGYSTVDFFTGLRASSDKSWDVSLWLKNAFDRRAVVRVFNPQLTDPATGNQFDQVSTNLPRQLGVTGTYRF
jgi:outer membrane receptor protein involved in Fe transport